MSAIPKSIDGDAITSEQHKYLDGFLTGLRNRGITFSDAEPDAGPKGEEKKKEKITNEEKIKRALNPLDALPVLRKKAKTNDAPEKEDIFRFKWNGLFWLAPVHEGYMCLANPPRYVSQYPI